MSRRATSLPLKGPQVLSNGTTPVTGLATWKRFTPVGVLPPPLATFPPDSPAVVRLLRGRRRMPSSVTKCFQTQTNCAALTAGSHCGWEKSDGCLSMHVVTRCNTDFKLEEACLYCFNIGWARRANALDWGVTVSPTLCLKTHPMLKWTTMSGIILVWQHISRWVFKTIEA